MQKEETVLNVQFVLLDCSPLKFSLVQHCNEWQNKFTQLLSLMASTRLKELHCYLHDSAQRCVCVCFRAVIFIVWLLFFLTDIRRSRLVFCGYNDRNCAHDPKPCHVNAGELF